MKKIIWSFLSLVLLGGALMGAVYLGKRSQDTRRGAAGNDAELLTLTGSETNEFNSGDSVTVQVKIDTKDRPIDTADIKLILSDAEKVTVESVEADAVFNDGGTHKYENGVVRLGGIIMKPTAQLPSGVVALGTIKLKVISGGTINFSLDNNSMITNGTDSSLIPIAYQGMTLTVSGGTTGVGTVNVVFDPASKTMAVGETSAVNLVVETGSLVFTGATLRIDFNRTKTEVLGVTVNSGYSKPVDFTIDNENGFIEGTALWMSDPSNLLSGDVSLLTIIIKGKAAASDSLRVVSSEMAGKNGDASGKFDVTVEPGNYTYTSEGTPTETPVPTAEPTGSTSDPLLSFKMAFDGVRPTGSECVNNWPLEVMVKGSDGETKKYTNVIAKRDAAVTDRAVFTASLRLAGFAGRENLAVFLKGPKHLQTKFGVDGQDSFYNQAGGKINVSVSGGHEYDFSKYPLMAGDVTGDTAGVADGKIDGRDFSFIKVHAAPVEGREEVAAGGYLQADLDGNCITSIQDVVLLMEALKEKQEQMY